MRRTVRFLALLFSFALVAPSASAFMIPRGFEEVASAPGVRLFRNRRDYMQVISLHEGARLQLLHGAFSEEGAHGTFQHKSIHDWWREWSMKTPGAFSVVNGQFFDPRDPDRAPIAFSMKANGRVYEGYADTAEFRGQKRLLALYPGKGIMLEYDDDPVSLIAMGAPDILIGLRPTAAKYMRRGMPRTFIAVAWTGEILLFSSSMASQRTADRTLRAFHADPNQMMMLDGGTSSHLLQGDRVLVPTSLRGDPRYGRDRLPQIIGVAAASDAKY